MIRDNRSELVVVLTTFPENGDLGALSRILISERLAACVQTHSACRSVYEWRGKLEETVEVPVVIKTMSDCLSKLKDRIRSLHPYEVPELIVLETKDGSDEYRRWVSAAVEERREGEENKKTPPESEKS